MKRVFGMPWWFWGFAAGVLLFGGVAYGADPTSVRKALRNAAKKYGVDPDLADALGKTEGPNWKLNARSTHPADEARGGSFGPTQISTMTARAYGYKGDMEDFRKNAGKAAEWTARILAARPGGAPTTAEETAAWWNGGATDLSNAPSSTQDSYYPKLLASLSYVQENPVA